MRATQTIRAAATSVTKNKLRSTLTMLGLVIGIFSVVVLVGIGNGSSAQVTQQVNSLGGNLLSVHLFEGDLRYANLDDSKALPNLDGIASAKSLGVEVTAGKLTTKRGSVEAVDEAYASVRDLKLSAGRALSAVDRQNQSKVCVIGSDVARDLLGGTDVVGSTIKLNGDEFRVVGVLEKQGESMGLYTEGLVLVPFSVAASLGGNDKVTALYAKADSEVGVAQAKQTLENYLATSKNLKQGQFVVTSQDKTLQAGSEISGTFTLLLGGIAGISLVVAGIGVMNVMLISVTERVREIGIKKALGAKRRAILLQFLMEALFLSLAGGALGVVAGFGFGAAVQQAGIPFEFSWAVVVVAVSASTLIGFAFGIFPAYRASRMNPIEALRQE